jgi:hypothetical protein
MFLFLAQNLTNMAIYRFHVEIEDYEGISREIDVKSTQTFEDLHYAILRAYGFDLKHPASFFYSDDLWHMEDEIAFKDIQYSVISDAMPMNKTRISDFIDDPHQRFLYVYQSDEGWAFLVELVGIDTGNGDGGTYPRMVKSAGEAPKQSPVKTIHKAKTDEKPSALMDALEDDTEEAADELVVFESLEAGTKSGKAADIDLDLSIDDDDDLSSDDEDEDLDDDDMDDDDDDDYSGGGKKGRGSNYDDDDY